MSKPEPKANQDTKPNVPMKSYLPAHLVATRPPPPPPPSPTSPSTSTKSHSTAAPSYHTRQTATPSYRSRPSAPPSPSKRLILTPLPPALRIPPPAPKLIIPAPEPRLLPFPNQHKRCYSAPLPPSSLTWSSDEEKGVTFNLVEDEVDEKECVGETPGSAFVHWLSLFSRDYVIPPAFQKLMN